jgi:hypothetical protein
MTKSTIGKWTLGIAGTILLGALGSGLWDVALKSIFTSIGRGVLTGISFGYGSIRDSCYLEIAKGHTDRASLWLVTFSLFPMLLALGYYIGRSLTRSRAPIETEEAKERMRVDPVFREKRLGELGAELETLKRKLVVSQTIFLLFVVFQLSLFMFRSITLSYISSAITHYEQSYTICLPFLSETDRFAIRSQYAQIHTKEDYVKVLRLLHDAAGSHNVSLPKFTPW